MIKKLLLRLTACALLLTSSISFGQTIDLGILSSFEAYTGTGAITNGSTSTFPGDVGSHTGAISGFASPYFTGTIHNSNSTTDQARIDLLKLYIDLNSVFPPTTHVPAFGSGETLSPGVYSVSTAGSIAGTVTLDGTGVPDAFFIIKFGGAMTVGASAVVNLINVDASNVFWIAEGAITVGASCIIKGTLFSHSGAISLGANVNLEGRMFSMLGAISIGAGSVATAPSPVSTIQTPCYGSIPAPDVDVLGSLENFGLFTSAGAMVNTGASGVFGDIGSNAGAISGFASAVHVGSVHNTDFTTATAKTDLDNAYDQLMTLTTTVTSHAPAFGSGETLLPGVYSVGGAGSLTGTITLDGGGNNDAYFVFKIGGAFSAAAESKVILTNGTRRCNVFWIAGAGVSTGAITIAAASNLKGTFISHAGACSLGAGAIIEGRLLTTAGLISTNVGTTYVIIDDE
ncbi:MAG: hypothetical protein ACI8QP_001676, partial [Porticoccaceae bacterium]